MQRLYPPPGEGDGSHLDTLLGLAQAYAYPPRDSGPYLRANMVAGLDGASRAEGHSAPLSSPADMRIFGTLRALADAVLVGAETVRHEGYGPAKARAAFADLRAADGQQPAPAIAVLTRRLNLDFSAPLFTQAVVPTIVLTGADCAASDLAAAHAAGAQVIIAGDGSGADPARAVRELAALGMTRLLHEGGPRILAQFAAAGLVDEMCLTLSPLLTGGDVPRILDGQAVDPPARYVPMSILEEDGFLFTRYVRG